MLFIQPTSTVDKCATGLWKQAQQFMAPGEYKSLGRKGLKSDSREVGSVSGICSQYVSSI